MKKLIFIFWVILSCGVFGQVSSFTYGSLKTVGSISAKSGSGGDILTVPVSYSVGTDPIPQVILSYIGPGNVSLPAGSVSFNRNGAFTIRITAQALVGRYSCQGISITESPGGTTVQQIWARGGEYYANGGQLQAQRHSFNTEDLDFTILAPVAPQITISPFSQIISAGGSVTFLVVASGTAPLSYQWLKDGVVISGATNASLVLSSVESIAAGSYTVIITNSAGSITSGAAALTINALTPAITLQPTSASAVAGSSIGFVVSASGTAPLTYQWRKNGVSISDATNSTLTLPNVQSGDVASYTVTVTNAVGSVTSNAATLTLLAPRLSNVSVRTTLAANQILTVGLTMQGGPKSAPIRAAGPGHGALGVAGTMADPELALFNGQTQIAAN
ncbi:MAG: immunoglobulin domain-containing protein, partial [Undibacterium sp.]|nr:immunoglobulin domain-containing protein [Opitutaceae bacterium]